MGVEIDVIATELDAFSTDATHSRLTRHIRDTFVTESDAFETESDLKIILLPCKMSKLCLNVKLLAKTTSILHYCIIKLLDVIFTLGKGHIWPSEEKKNW